MLLWKYSCLDLKFVSRRLREKCPNTDIFLVRIWKNTDQKKTPYLDTFHASRGTGVLKYAERKCVGRIEWLQILTSEKCTVPLKEWMTASILVITPFKERIAGTNFFLWNKHITDKRIAQTTMTASSPVKITTLPFKEWMTAIVSMTKKDTLLQGMDGCNYSGEINRLPFKKSSV